MKFIFTFLLLVSFVIPLRAQGAVEQERIRILEEALAQEKKKSAEATQINSENKLKKTPLEMIKEFEENMLRAKGTVFARACTGKVVKGKFIFSLVNGNISLGCEISK